MAVISNPCLLVHAPSAENLRYERSFDHIITKLITDMVPSKNGLVRRETQISTFKSNSWISANGI